MSASPSASPAASSTAKPRPLSLPPRPQGATSATGSTASTGSQATITERPSIPRPAPAKAQDGSTPSSPTSKPATGATRFAGAAATASAIRPATGVSGSTAPAKPAAPDHPPSPAPAPLNSSLNRTTVVLDPARGGADGGSRIADAILEKDVTLALAFRLRSLLAARGFNAVLTREDDAAVEAKSPNTPLSLNDRAGIANHARGAACLLLHATGSGTGVHLYSSELAPVPAEVTPLPWLTAQAAWLPQSHRLLRLLGESLNRAEVPLVASVASVRPLDSLTCPAVVVELAPRTDDPTTINDAAYQQRVAEALVGTLVFWQNAAQPPTRLAPPLRPVATRSHPAAPEVTP